MTNLFSNVTISENKTSPVIELDPYDSFSIQSVVKGATASGQLILEVSNDNTEWSEIDLVTVSGPVNWAWAAMKTPDFQYFRMRFVFTAGTGTLTATLRGKTMRGGNRRVLGVI